MDGHISFDAFFHVKVLKVYTPGVTPSPKQPNL